MGEGKPSVALITGAAQGIGKEVARRFAQEGFFVALLDQNVQNLHAVEESLKSEHYQVKAFSVDITKSKYVEEIIDDIEKNIGPIECLANVAGVLRMGKTVELSDEDWAATFAVNTTGVFVMSRTVSRYMINRRRGSIVTVSSNAGHMPRIDMAAYASSKAAATMFTKCLGLELAQFGIRCNVVAPGSTNTEMLKLLWEDEKGEENVIKGSLETYKTGIPLHKIATPSDIAEAVLFLSSDKAGHITMNSLCVDGGATLGV
ncbi:2,3-dihydro-2,3-dihydroxybenzoate dehydrogenase [Priestia endophytica]|uniref:2,3-dihydro-2,3-dihydroxybenzoate dehydrogenase n=1 Tax=Priestia endophytica TaxID=135735 RepID=UPI00227FDAE5|nr:2,3-dihydro-2,3-dihydroxybenzoate dehydrogenase [Priestia endophytica]MCY8232168.1 2,3-dihydro-2,3-dihydroxybenzoate dehydrogenase [Priestia endophytica]